MAQEGSPVEAESPPSLSSLSPNEGPPISVWGGLLRPYLSGASYILNQADRGSPLLNRFCKRLGDLLFYHVFAVGYLTPPNSFAVATHTDAQVSCLEGPH